MNQIALLVSLGDRWGREKYNLNSQKPPKKPMTELQRSWLLVDRALPELGLPILLDDLPMGSPRKLIEQGIPVSESQGSHFRGVLPTSQVPQVTHFLIPGWLQHEAGILVFTPLLPSLLLTSWAPPKPFQVHSCLSFPFKPSAALYIVILQWSFICWTPVLACCALQKFALSLWPPSCFCWCLPWNCYPNNVHHTHKIFYPQKQ